MKEKNIEVIQTTISNFLDGEFWKIEEYFPQESILWIVTNIYLNNDTSVEVSNRVNDVATVIASRYRISVIMDPRAIQGDDRSTYVKMAMPLCQYEDVSIDIFNILEIWETCVLRLGL